MEEKNDKLCGIILGSFLWTQLDAVIEPLYAAELNLDRRKDNISIPKILLYNWINSSSTASCLGKQKEI